MQLRITKCFIGIAVFIVLLHPAMAINAATRTIATFADPAADGNTPLFTVDVTGGQVTGGWTDPGLILEIPGIGSFTDTTFAMTPLSYSGSILGGTASDGSLSFYEAGAIPGSTPPLVMISFDSVQCSPGGLYATEQLSMNDVTITGSAVPGGLAQESFSFAFANQELFSEGEGFTATASFTSSAIPEPTIIAYMAIAIPMGIFGRRIRQSFH